MLRFLIAAPVALLLSLMLFYSLALMTSMGEKQNTELQLNPTLDFLMIRNESDIELRQRQLPPEPQDILQQQPKMPRLKTQKVFHVDASLPSIDVPDISTDLDVNLSPSLHNLVMPSALAIDTSPVVISRYPPRYPQRAIKRRLEGKVVVEFFITEQGTVKKGSVVVIESTPPGVFDRAVLQALKHWHFKKRLENGQAVTFKARQELKFNLEK